MNLDEENIFFVGGGTFLAIILLMGALEIFNRPEIPPHWYEDEYLIINDAVRTIPTYGSLANPIIFSSNESRQISFYSGKKAHFLLRSGKNPFYITNAEEIHKELFATGYQYIVISCYKESWKPEAIEAIGNSEYFILIWSSDCHKVYVLKWYESIYRAQI